MPTNVKAERVETAKEREDLLRERDALKIARNEDREFVKEMAVFFNTNREGQFMYHRLPRPLQMSVCKRIEANSYQHRYRRG